MQKAKAALVYEFPSMKQIAVTSFDPNIPHPQFKSSPVDPPSQPPAQSPADSEAVELLSERERMELLERDGLAGNNAGAK